MKPPATPREVIARILADSYSGPYLYRDDEWRENRDLWVAILDTFEAEVNKRGLKLPSCENKSVPVPPMVEELLL